MSDGGQGAGVVGLSIKSFANNDIPGVPGGRGNGAGTGVLGESDSGSGVVGSSRTSAGVAG